MVRISASYTATSPSRAAHSVRTPESHKNTAPNIPTLFYHSKIKSIGYPYRKCHRLVLPYKQNHRPTDLISLTVVYAAGSRRSGTARIIVPEWQSCWASETPGPLQRVSSQSPPSALLKSPKQRHNLFHIPSCAAGVP